MDPKMPSVAIDALAIVIPIINSQLILCQLYNSSFIINY